MKKSKRIAHVAAPSGGKFAALDIKHVDPKTIKVDTRNPRAITPEARAKLQAGIEEVGLVAPFVIREEDGEMIGGHQKLAIMIELGYTSVPVVYVKGLSKTKARAFGTLLNNPKAQGTFVENELRQLLDEAEKEGALDLTGFDVGDLHDMAKTDDDVAIHERPVPKAGALAWYLVQVPIEEVAEVSQRMDELVRDVPGVSTWAALSDDASAKR